MKKRNIAKTALAVLSVMTIGAAGASLAACDKDGEHTHSYGKWTLITDPTLTAGGKAERYCKDNDGGKEEKDVPVLTDTSVWTENLTVKVDPTCSAEGKREFTSADYGTVTVTLAVDADVHSYGKWTLTKKPTETERGEAVRVCGANGDHTETKTDVPVLTDTSVWTLDAEKSQAPTHTADGINVYTSAEYGEVTVPVSKSEDAHVYGDWTFVGGQPTLTAGGKIQRTCSDSACGHVEEEDVPALSDTSFWTKTETEPATHQTAGIADFANAEYGIKVEGVTVPKLAHTFGAWEITQEPTATSKGTATRTCTLKDCAEDETAVETKELPELTDAFWTKSHTAANYNSGSTDTYTNSEYGLEIKKVADDKKPAPYDDVDYYCFGYYIDSEGKLLSRTCDNLYGGPILPLDKNTATGTTYPVNGKVVINSKNPEVLNGEIDFIIDGEVYPAYYDAETKIIVLIYSSTDIKIFTPYYDIREVHKDILDENDNVTDSVIFNANFAKKDGKAATITVGNDTVFAVEYNYADGKTIGICVNEGAVTFNVKFTDLDGTASDLSAMDGYTNLFVKDADGNKVENFGYNPSTERWQVCDGFEGEYEVKYCDVNKIVVNGAGAIDCTFCNGDERSSTYKYEGVDGFGRENISTVIGKDYFVFAFDNDGKVTGMKKNVRIVFNFNSEEVLNTDEFGTVNEDGNYELSVSKTVPFKLPVPLNNEKMFIGWYLDKDCKTPVELDKDGNYVPVHIYSINFYAKWSQKHSFTLKTDADDAGTAVYFGDGEIIGKFLPDHDIDLDNWRSFDGWFVNTADGEMQINAETELSAGDDGIVVYGKWTALPVYYGEYNGASGTYDTEAHITIDKDGNVTGSTRWGTIERNFTATVQSYKAETQTLVWQTVDFYGDTRNVKVLFYSSADHSSRIFVMHEQYGSNVEVGASNFLLTNGENVEFAEGGNKGIDFNALGGYTGGKTRVVKYTADGAERLMLIYGNKIYTDVTLENYLGEKVEHADVLNGKTLVVKQNGNIITALGTTSANLGANNAEVKLLDSFYGKYTFETAEYLIDGIGNMTDGTKTYEYEVIDENKISAFELNEEKARTAHFVVTFDNGNIASIIKEMANLTMDGEVVSINTKIPYVLEALGDKDGKVFAGWHIKSDLSDEVITSITVEADTVIYADWREAVEVTFDANGGKFVDDITIKKVNAAKGMPLTMDEVPVHPSNAAFLGWFVDDETEWKSGETKVDTAVTVTAKWSLAPYIREYKGGYVMWPYDTVTRTQAVLQLNSGNAIINISDEEKEYTDVYLPFASCTGKGTYTVSVTHNEDTNEITFTTVKGNNTYVNSGYIDPATGVIVVNYRQSEEFDLSSKGVAILLPSEYSFITGRYCSSWMGDKWNFYLDIKGKENKETSIFVNGTSIYLGAIAKDEEGNRISSEKFNKNSYIAIYASETASEPVLLGGYNGSNIVPFDDYRGEYTDATYGTVKVNGVGGITLNNGTDNAKSGKYTVVSENVLATTIDKVYYEIAVDKTAKTCTVTAPEAAITFTFANATVEFDGSQLTSGTAVQHGVEVEFALPVPVPVTGYQFVGWFTEEAFTNKVEKYTLHKGDDIELFAKIVEMPEWASKDTAEAAVFTDGSATITGETDALNLKHWTKLEIAEDGVYVFSSKTPVKTSSNSDGIHYARYSIVSADGTAVEKTIPFGDGHSKQKTLTAGTYYVEVHLGGAVTGASGFTCLNYGTFEITVKNIPVVEYSVGASIEVVASKSEPAIYKVDLEAGTNYTVSFNRTKQSNYTPLTIYSDMAMSATVMKLSGWVNEKTGDFTVSATATYYIAIIEDLTFSIVAKTSTETPEPSANPFKGNTYKKTIYDYDYETNLTLTFDNADTMSGTLKIETADGWGSSTFTFVNGTLSGDTLILTNASDKTIVFTVSAENSKLKILSSSTYSGIVDYSNETLTKQA